TYVTNNPLALEDHAGLYGLTTQPMLAIGVSQVAQPPRDWDSHCALQSEGPPCDSECGLDPTSLDGPLGSTYCIHQGLVIICCICDVRIREYWVGVEDSVI